MWRCFKGGRGEVIGMDGMDDQFLIGFSAVSSVFFSSFLFFLYVYIFLFPAHSSFFLWIGDYCFGPAGSFCSFCRYMGVLFFLCFRRGWFFFAILILSVK